VHVVIVLVEILISKMLMWDMFQRSNRRLQDVRGTFTCSS